MAQGRNESSGRAEGLRDGGQSLFSRNGVFRRGCLEEDQKDEIQELGDCKVKESRMSYTELGLSEAERQPGES